MRLHTEKEEILIGLIKYQSSILKHNLCIIKEKLGTDCYEYQTTEDTLDFISRSLLQFDMIATAKAN
jgi:hypothetical protein